PRGLRWKRPLVAVRVRAEAPVRRQEGADVGHGSDEDAADEPRRFREEDRRGDRALTGAEGRREGDRRLEEEGLQGRRHRRALAFSTFSARSLPRAWSASSRAYASCSILSRSSRTASPSTPSASAARTRSSYDASIRCSTRRISARISRSPL